MFSAATVAGAAAGMRRVRASRVLTWLAAAFAIMAPGVSAQTSTPAMERLELDEAVRRALERNPTVAQAAEAILRAEGLLQQARAATRPNVSAFITTATLDAG